MQESKNNLFGDQSTVAETMPDHDGYNPDYDLMRDYSVQLNGVFEAVTGEGIVEDRQ
ncbi:hypothetical protein [Paenibacillus contaminans]|uniref:hypothetical protein n=1 Tax=Paenibacillus contaminans TaxID=450362 RepID=UPI0013149CA2|nr:hypothetical protein [Paenibacillus contaminans]